MEMQKPHKIVTDAEEIEWRKEAGRLLMPLTSGEAAHLKEKTVNERGLWLQKRLDSIRDYCSGEALSKADGTEPKTDGDF